MSRMPVRILLSSVALVASAGTVVVAADVSASAAQSTTITSVSPSKPIASEQFLVRGTIATEVARPVVLERKTKSSWKTVKSGVTNDVGRFSFQTTTTGKKTYRVVAPKVVIATKTYGQRVTATRTVNVAKQTGKTSVSPTKVKQAGTLTLAGTFTPAREGRPVFVRIAYPNGESELLPLAVQNAKGKASLTIKGIEALPGTYKVRAVAGKWNGAATKSGNEVKFVVTK